MKLILDINIIISALIKEKSIIRALLNIPFFEFYIPDYAIKELKKYEYLILEKTGMNKEDLRILIKTLLSRVKIIEKKVFQPYCKQAEKIIGKIDKKDVPYIALALTIENNGIWTADEHFKKQDYIKIFTTEDLIKLFGINQKI